MKNTRIVLKVIRTDIIIPLLDFGGTGNLDVTQNENNNIVTIDVDLNDREAGFFVHDSFRDFISDRQNCSDT